MKLTLKMEENKINLHEKFFEKNIKLDLNNNYFSSIQFFEEIKQTNQDWQ